MGGGYARAVRLAPPPAMPDPLWFRLDDRGAPGARATLYLQGNWRLGELPGIDAALQAHELPASLTVDASALAALDSASALVLLRKLARSGDVTWSGLEPAHARIVEQARAHFGATQRPPPPARPPGVLARFGRASTDFADLLHGHLNFLGATIAALGAVVLRPWRLRPRELTVQVEQAGLDAIPVVSLVTLLIGVVVAYLLGLQAEKYGANIFVVDGVAIGATREFAPIIVAVIVAGRSGAAFTAQLGSMKLTEEIDALRTLGLDPWQVLVVPRVLALMLLLPLLVFVGNVASLLGAMIVTSTMLDITPAGFLARLHEALEMRHIVVGLVKAPVFALVIAVIGTRMGMTVARDTRAVGIATTSTVVQSIVAVILIDAGFAVWMQAMGW